jgi:hypothetical protein
MKRTSKNLKQLRRFLSMSAPCLTTAQLRQSRRLEGQLTRGGEIRAYSEVLIAAGTDCHAFSGELRVIAKAITALQIDERRGTYTVRLRPFDATAETVSTQLGDKSSATMLRDFVLDNLGDDEKPGHLDTLPSVSKAALILMLSGRGQDVISPEVKDQLAKHPKKQVVWCILEQDVFTWGSDCPLEVE